MEGFVFGYMFKYVQLVLKIRWSDINSQVYMTRSFPQWKLILWFGGVSQIMFRPYFNTETVFVALLEFKNVKILLKMDNIPPNGIWKTKCRRGWPNLKTVHNMYA